VSNWIYIAVTFGLAGVFWWVIHLDVRRTLRQARDGGAPGGASSPLDAAMERIVPPAAPRPEQAAPEPITSAALAVIDHIDHANCHQLARPNGRQLADRIRRDCPWLTDAQGAQLCVTLTLFAADQQTHGKGSPWLVFTDALAFAAVEFSALERTDQP
jgi:hypothetical protein